MATGILFDGELVADTDTFFGPVPVGQIWSFSVTICNQFKLPASIRLALCPTNNIVDAKYIEYNSPLPGNTPLERTQLVLQAGGYVMVRATAPVLVTGYGFEE